MSRRAEARQELLIAVVFACALLAPFLGKAYAIDEPWFIYVARQWLAHPDKPFAFAFNYWGTPTDYAKLADHPPLIYALVALALKAGGGEWGTRLALLPIDAAAAAGLYLLASRFLAFPLLPVLTVLACPGYWLNMGHVMAEKPAVALSFWGLYALVRGVDDEDAGWFWGSSLLLGAAMLFKYNAGIFLVPALAYAARRGRLARLAAYAALALCGPVCCLALSRWNGWGQASASLGYLRSAYARPWSAWPHKLRSLLAFAGGCGLATAVWPFWAARPTARQALACAGAAALLFFPALDLAPVVRPVDRLTGAVLAFGALWGFYALWRRYPRRSGFVLWTSWSCAALAGVWCYWCVTSRMVLYALPPLILAAAEALETGRPDQTRRRLQLATVGALLAFGLCLELVDERYADAQRDFAARIALEYPGRRVWCASVGGLKHYLEAGGAITIDKSRGGWAQVRPGDVVVLSKITNALGPDRRILANVRAQRVDSAIPLRLLSLWTGEGGFYADVWGFLPFSLSREPLDEFTVVEAL